MRVRVPDGAFWIAPDADVAQEFEDVLDCAFVDDECIILLAKNPAIMDRSIDIVLRVLVSFSGAWTLVRG
jgi:hypothetical protein